MTSSEERLKVLKMVQEEKISADEAAQLLETLENSGTNKQTASSGGNISAGRWFRVRVTDTNSGKTRVNVRMPLGVVSAGIKMGMKFTPQVEGLDPTELATLIQNGDVGQIVDAYDEDDGEHVEVFIE